MARWCWTVWCCVVAALGARAQHVGAPRCPAEAAQRCQQGGSGQDEYTYTIDGVNLLIQYTDGGYFLLRCPDNITLENTALPRFETLLRVKKATLTDCPAPRSSYAASLAALNVTVLERLSLVRGAALQRAQLAGLAHLSALVLDATALRPGALAALPHLRRLHVDGATPARADLLSLPPELQSLQLVRTGAAVTPDVLRRLPHLVNLTMRDSVSMRLRPAGALQSVALDAPAADVSQELLPTLRRLTVYGWSAARPGPWGSCGALRRLELRYAAVSALPPRWVAACGALQELLLQNAPRLGALPAALLGGARALRELRVTDCALTSLPAQLLDDAPDLTVLDLSGNGLLALPGGFFVTTSRLQSLYLSNNNLSADVFHSVSVVDSLTRLDLSDNVELKDACSGSIETVIGSSPLQNLQNLKELNLRNTSATRICRDWRQNLHRLTKLDLSKNRITVVTFTDLQFQGREDVDLSLSGNNITTLYYAQADYEKVAAGESSRAVLRLDATLRCDCDVYWAARALREHPAHLRARQRREPRCASGLPLGAASPDDLFCRVDYLCAGLPAACRCAERPRAGLPARVVRLHCENVMLTRVPRLPPLRAVWHLRLAHNHITELGDADLPQHYEALDLRHNGLSVISPKAAEALVADERRRVWLADNPLTCDCSTAASLAVLRARPAALRDYDAVACDGGGLLADFARDCSVAWRGAWLGVGAALALLLAAALLAALALPRARRRVKAALRLLGWLPARPASADGLRYDAFVSFAHGDERIVRELVARLEAGPAPLRLCVHYRDWAPGGWIPAQIAASVRASRRTVAVVSAHFLASAWARAEWQEAHALALRDAEPRLVVVLLDDPARLPLDARLRDYLARNTYVRWGDPWFWPKLRNALPRGAAPPASALDGERALTAPRDDPEPCADADVTPRDPAPAPLPTPLYPTLPPLT